MITKHLVNFVNKSINDNPKYAHDGDSGFDLRANVYDMLYIPDEEVPTVYIEPWQRTLVPTGLYFQLPEDFEMQIRSRSGLALKNGIIVLNSPGTIDNKYNGEICVILMNLSNEAFPIRQGDRIAQAVICSVSSNNVIDLNSVVTLPENSGRNNNGFGSTGLK